MGLKSYVFPSSNFLETIFVIFNGEFYDFGLLRKKIAEIFFRDRHSSWYLVCLPNLWCFHSNSLAGDNYIYCLPLKKFQQNFSQKKPC